MRTSDLLYLALLVATLLVDHLVIWRRFSRQPATQARQARRVLWRSWIAMLWLLALGVFALWRHAGRPWGLLGLAVPTGWRLWASAGLVLAVLALYAQTVAGLARTTPARKAALRARFGDKAAMLPQTRTDLAWFTALSLTAGFSEELVFRGYLVWILQPVAGLWGAAALSCLAFALAHAYQGARGIVGTGVIGALFMGVVLATGSLVPAIVLHALIDVAQGIVAWCVLRDQDSTDVAGDAPAAPVPGRS